MKRSLNFFLAFIACVFVSVSVDAQPRDAVLTLNSEAEIYDIVPFSYLTKDVYRSLSWRDVLDRHNNNIRGERQNNAILNTGFGGVPHYLLFTLKNESNTEDWVIDFGHVEDGRAGIMASIYLYDTTRGAMLLDGYARPNAPYDLGKELHQAALPFELEPGQSATMLLYFEGTAGLPNTLPITVLSKTQYLAQGGQSSALSVAFYVFMLVSIGIFLTLFSLKRQWKYAAVIVYFIGQTGLFYFIETHFLGIQNSNAMYVGILLNIIALVYLWLSKFVLEITGTQNVIKSLFIYLATGYIGVSLLFVFGFIAYFSALDPLWYYGGLTLSAFLTFIFAFTQMDKNIRGSGFYLTGTLVFLVGVMVSLFAYIGVLSPSVYLINAYWISLLPQGILYVAAGIIKYRHYLSLDVRRQLRDSQEADSVARLRQSKESADQQRLLRVLEREREVMEELRQREALRTEEMRKAKESADEANRAKSAFLAVISHEIRTPMTGIMGMVRLLQDTQLTKQQNEYVTTIQESGNTMLALLNDILDFEKIETGKMDIEVIGFDLHRLLRSVITLMSGRANEQGIGLSLDLRDNVPVYLKGDPTRIRQILLNLVGNAIKFTTEGGVTLQVQCIDEEETPTINNKKAIYFAVKDTGIGISEEGQKQLFNPFSQADSSISRKFGGSGLGLAICKALIEAMGSAIHINSKEGYGSTFFFTLHLEEDSNKAGEGRDQGFSETTVKQEVRPVRILVAEDNEINQKVIYSFLEKYKHDIDVASNGREAVDKTRQNTYDVIMMDVEMPEMDGLQAVREIRSHNGPNQNIPIYALTGNVQKDDIDKYLSNGMNGHIAKPINPEDIERALLDAEKTREILAGDDEDVLPVTEEKPAPILIKDPDAPKEENGQANAEQPNIVTDGLAEGLTEAVIDDGETDDTLHQAAGEHAPLDEDRFDEAMLKSLKDSLGKDSLEELLEGLYEKTEELIDAIDTAMIEKNVEELHARGHELKGMAGNFGLKEISSIAAKIERNAKEKKIDDLPELISKLPKEYEASRKELSYWIQV